MLETLLEGLGMQTTAVKAIPSLADSCKCSDERVYRTLRLLPRSEVDDIMVKNEQVQVKCEFCGQVYRLSPQQIKEKLES